MNNSNQPLRKLAVLVDSLDSQTAGSFLNRVPTRTAETIRRHVVDLGKVSRSEREQVLQQFLFAVHGVQDAMLGGRAENGVAERIRAVPPSALPTAQIAIERRFEESQ